jgi:hypothetical protein
MSASNSVSQDKTDQTAYNEQTGVGGNGIALGANSSGNTIDVTSSDPTVTVAALEAGQNETAAALGTGLAGEQAALNFASQANSQNNDIVESVTSSYEGALSQSTQAAFDLAKTALSANDNIATAAAPQTPSYTAETLSGQSNSTTVILVVVVAVAAYLILKH